MRWIEMKFGNLYWHDTQNAGSNVIAVNIGDNLQFMVIDYLYSKLLPETKQIVKLQMSDVKRYHGEDLILPMNWNLFEPAFMNNDRFAVSENIIPVFLAMTIESASYKETYFNDYNIAYLKRYEPIGCRDEYTLNTLQEYHIKAYLNGCMTSVLPKREDKGQTKIFFVDVPVDLLPYIPDEVKGNFEVMTQQYYFGTNMAKEAVIDLIKNQYQKYADEAGLVVTSRLHVASPCMAMGIPVVFVKNQIDARFGWLDKYLPLYDKANFSRIDWKPRPIEYEKRKEVIIQNAVRRIMGVYEQYHNAEEVNAIYEVGNREKYVSFQQTIYNNFDKAKVFLDENYTKEDKFDYSIWGINIAAENFYEYMTRKYPYAQLKDAIDAFKQTEFHGVSTVKPDDFNWREGEIVFVLPVKASNEAERVFAEKGIGSKYYVCCGDQFIGCDVKREV